MFSTRKSDSDHCSQRDVFEEETGKLGIQVVHFGKHVNINRNTFSSLFMTS